MTSSTPLLIVISAPSGGGKTTLCDQLLARRSDITRAVTCTTRNPRQGEQDGVHYHFLKREDFQTRIEAGEFLEHASVFENLYGTLKSEVVGKLQSGRHVLLNIDVQGAASIRAAAAADPFFKQRLISVFLTPSSKDELEKRLQKRGSETAETLARRLAEASTEVAEWCHFDYLILSSSVSEDVRRMEVILEAELMKQQRSEPPKF